MDAPVEGRVPNGRRERAGLYVPPFLVGKGQKEALDGIGKFVMLWRRTGDEWRVSRVISYGFRPPE